jgi:hypothetical protein
LLKVFIIPIMAPKQSKSQPATSSSAVPVAVAQQVNPKTLLHVTNYSMISITVIKSSW